MDVAHDRLAQLMTVTKQFIQQRRRISMRLCNRKVILAQLHVTHQIAVLMVPSKCENRHSVRQTAYQTMVSAADANTYIGNE